MDFIDLPCDIVSYIVTGWFRWKEVGRFDGALCNRQKRNMWLQLLRDKCIFGSLQVSPNRKGHVEINWILSREIQTAKLVIDDDCTASPALFIWFAKQKTSISRLIDFSGNHDMLNSNKPALKNITSFVGTYNELTSSFWDVLQACTNLKALRITCYELGVIPENISFPYLTKLSINIGTSDERVHRFAYLFQNVRSLCVSGIDREFKKLIGCFPSIEHLNLLGRENAQKESNFIEIMRDIKTGLRALEFTQNAGWTPRALHAVSSHHAHSLRYLSIDIYNQSYCIGIAQLVNFCPLLKTLCIGFAVTCIHTADTVLRNIRNASITTLHVQYCSSSVLSCLTSNSFPALKTLGLHYVSVDIAVNKINELLNRFSAVRTVYVDTRIFAELRTLLWTRGVEVLRSDFGLFTFNHMY